MSEYDVSCHMQAFNSSSHCFPCTGHLILISPSHMTNQSSINVYIDFRKNIAT